MARGFFIVFEGIDGCGKTSQVSRTVEYLKDKFSDVQVESLRELGGSSLGEKLREIMYKHVPPKDMAPGVLDLLFLMGHVQNWWEVVQPSLTQGKIVVSDRWWLSQFAYAAGRDFDPRVNELYEKLKGGWPDLTIFLYGNPHELFKRANSRSDAKSHQKIKTWNDAEKQKLVSDRYFQLYENMSGWIPICVDGKNENEVWLEIKKALWLSPLARPGAGNETWNVEV